jgi:Uma2 family endonuclease
VGRHGLLCWQGATDRPVAAIFHSSTVPNGVSIHTPVPGGRRLTQAVGPPIQAQWCANPSAHLFLRHLPLSCFVWYDDGNGIPTRSVVEAIMAVQIARWQFTVDDYHRMRETGILAEDDHVELIDGEVRRMSPIGPFHAAIVKRLNNLLSTATTNIIISVQDPIQLDDYSEPEPDIALLQFEPSYYAHNHPTPSDILFLIEVADTSLDYDRNEKIPRYAEAQIPEVWLIDVEAERIEQFTSPLENQYTLRQTYKRGDHITSVVLPDITLAVSQIFGL